MLWHQAVASVHFEFFEVTNPMPTYRWGGGFAAGPSGSRDVWHIDVICQIDDSEIVAANNPLSIATTSSPNEPARIGTLRVWVGARKCR